MQIYVLIILGFITSLCPSLQAEESITGRYAGYREICKKAAQDPYYFQNFRTFAEYRCALELSEGDIFAQYIAGTSSTLRAKLEAFRKLDTIGNAPTVHYPSLGNFSGTTLRYIVLAHQMTSMFRLPTNAKIVEIGAGFGGQCFILSQLQPFSTYYIYDLPEVEALINKVMEALSVKAVKCLPIEVSLPENKIDLVISNYAYSECDRNMQLEYFEKVIKKAERGYLIYNDIARKDYGIDSLSANEFVQLLKNNGIRPKICNEFLSTAPGNVLITWDNTKNRKK